MPAIIPYLIMAAGSVGAAEINAHAQNKGSELAAKQNEEVLDFNRAKASQSGERDAWKDLVHANHALDSKGYNPQVPGVPYLGIASKTPLSANPDVKAGAEKLSADALSRIQDPSKAAGGTPTDVSSYYPGTGQSVAGAALAGLPMLLKIFQNHTSGDVPIMNSKPGQLPYSFGTSPSVFDGFATDGSDLSWMDEGIG